MLCLPLILICAATQVGLSPLDVVDSFASQKKQLNTKKLDRG
jgi:hypothetical protein